MKITKRQLSRIIRETLEETENTCWSGYSPGAQSGVKTKKGKGGKRVANCEEINEDDKEALEEAMIYHLNAGAGVDQNIFRPGSTAFFDLFREARRRFYEGAYDPRSLEEYELLEDLDIGEFAIEGFRDLLLPGKNVLAIEGHNVTADSSAPAPNAVSNPSTKFVGFQNLTVRAPSPSGAADTTPSTKAPTTASTPS